MKRDRKWIVLFSVLAVVLIGFIFSNSMQSKTVSHKRSTHILKILSHHKKKHTKKKTTSFWKQLVKQFPVLSLKKDRGIRKLAHLLEYAALGWDLFALSIYVRRYASRRRFAVFLLFCALVPWVDECIQVFVPGRSAAFFDVCLDWSGMVFGALICAGMHFCVCRMASRRTKVHRR